MGGSRQSASPRNSHFAVSSTLAHVSDERIVDERSDLPLEIRLVHGVDLGGETARCGRATPGRI
jgi:hypothetical protein